MRKLPETINENELMEILKATNKKHHKLAFCLGFYQGLRISEIVNLLPENIDYEQHLIRIKQAKGNKDRNIPIMPELIRKLNILPIKCGVRALEIAFKNSCRKAGIKKELYFHCLRHSSATWLLNTKRWDIRMIQQFLGHARLDTTQIYSHVSAQNLVDLVWKDDKPTNNSI